MHFQSTPPIASHLAPGEVIALCDRLLVGMLAVGPRFVLHGALLFALMLGLALILGPVKGNWPVAGLSVVFGMGFLALALGAARKNDPVGMARVVDAVRDNPEKVLEIRHYTTSDSRRVFVTHWIETRTADARLLVQADADWHTLLAALSRRCPRAAVSEG